MSKHITIQGKVPQVPFRFKEGKPERDNIIIMRMNLWTRDKSSQIYISLTHLQAFANKVLFGWAKKDSNLNL